MIEVNQDRKEEEYLKQVQRLQKTICMYEELAQRVRTATVIDRSIYTSDQDPDWLSLDRDDYGKVMESLSKIDLWKPWNNML